MKILVDYGFCQKELNDRAARIESAIDLNNQDDFLLQNGYVTPKERIEKCPRLPTEVKS